MQFVRKLLPLLALAVLSPESVRAQSLAAACPRIPVPFGPGEEALYNLKFGLFNAGEGRLAVTAVDTIRGEPSYRLEMFLEGSVVIGSIKYDMKSWLDTDAPVSRRHTRDIMELRTPRHRFYEIFPEERRWERTDTEEKGSTLHPCPLDDVSFIYYLRSQPLNVGETYEIRRYFKEDGNPVKIQVVRKDRIEVPAGTFNTIVVRPTIKTSGLFSEGGKAEIHLTDDQYRDVVYMRVEIPVVGSMSLHLKELRRGTPLPGASR